MQGVGSGDVQKATAPVSDLPPYPGSSGGSAVNWGTPPATPGGTGPQSAPGGGAFNFDISSPQGLVGSVGTDVNQGASLAQGVGQAAGQGLPGQVLQGLFGQGNGSLLGGVPLVGDLARFVGGIPGGIGDTLKNTVGAIDESGLASIIPGANLATAIGGGKEQLDAMYAALPDSPEKQAVQAQIDAKPFGIGVSALKENLLKAAYAQAKIDNPQPSLAPELTQMLPSTTIGDAMTNLLGVIGLTVRPVERLFAGAPKIGNGGLNRMQEIEKVATGQYSFEGSNRILADGGLNQVEQVAYQKWKSGEWTIDQSLDFLSASGAGFSHSAILNVGAEVFLDPQVWGSMGAGALNKLGITGMKLVHDAEIAAQEGSAVKTIIGTGETVNKVNKALLARLTGPGGSDVVRAFAEHVYTPLNGTMLGKMARGVRLIVDPLNAMSHGGSVVGTATTDLTSDVGVKLFVGAHGDKNVIDLANDIAKGGGTAFYDEQFKHATTYTANVLRRVAARYQRNRIVADGLKQNLDPEALSALYKSGTTDDAITNLLKNAPPELTAEVRQEFLRVQSQKFTDADRIEVAKRFAASNPTLDMNQWADVIKGWNPEQLSFYHAISYGHATEDFVKARSAAIAGLDEAGVKAMKLDRINLMNSNRLTDIHLRALISKVGKAEGYFGKHAAEMKTAGHASFEEYAASLIREAQATYPELSYYHLQPKNLANSITGFIAKAENDLRKGLIPAELQDKELAKLPQPIRDLAEKYKGIYKFGFAPEDDLKWGLDHDLEGRPFPRWEPWTDHVAADSAAFRPSYMLDHNIAGMPIVGRFIPGAAVDAIQAGARTLARQVDGEVVRLNAQNRFMRIAQEKHGLDKAEAKAMWDSLQQVTQLLERSTRSLSADNIWEAVKAFVPTTRKLGATFTSRDALSLVLDSFEGDMRYVGLTQKLTGKAKVLFGKSGSNLAGEISEKLWTDIKFKINSVFQTQEKIEGAFLNGARGISASFGTKMNDADRLTSDLLLHYGQTGTHAISDFEMREFSAQGLIGKSIEDSLAAFRDESWFKQALNVKGVKRINYLRATRHNWGVGYRKAFADAGNERAWDDIVSHYSIAEGRHLSDDEAVIKHMSENSLVGADITVPRLVEPGSTAGVFADAIHQGVYQKPHDIGAMQPLELDKMVRTLTIDTVDKSGRALPTLQNAKELREAIDRGEVTIDDVAKSLNDISADPSYIDRVKNALNFNYETFTKSLQENYNLTGSELRSIQDIIDRAASSRGMTPVDYLSQQFAPVVKGGSSYGSAATANKAFEQKLVADLADHVDLLRAAKNGTKQSTITDLTRQMSRAFLKHIDPSMQRTLVEHYAAETGTSFEQDILDRLQGREPNVVDLTSPTAYESAHAGITPAFITVRTEKGSSLYETGNRLFGPNWRNLPEEQQRTAIEQFNEHNRTFPDVPLKHSDLVDLQGKPFHASDVTMGATEPESGSVFLSSGHYGAAHGETDTRDIIINEAYKRANGIYQNVDPTFAGTITHERFHAILEKVDHGDYPETDNILDDWWQAISNKTEAAPSNYAKQNFDEAGAELFTLALSPNSPKELQSEYAGWVEDLKGAMEKDGLYTPNAAPANAVNPAIEPAIQEFSKWSQNVMHAGLLGATQDKVPAGAEAFQELFTKVTRIPTEYARPFNHTEQAIFDGMTSAIKQGEQDAFRLHYFARSRSVFERSINHPIIGIYPASYMWGKILPELARFVAREPFGLKTGAVAYALADVQKAIAIQREFDPEFGKMVDAAQGNGLVYFLQYLLPALPWDVSSAAPAWIRNLSAQGQANQKLIDSGQKAKPIDLFLAASKTANLANPFRQVTQVQRAIDATTKLAQPSAEQKAQQDQQNAAAAANPTGPTQATDIGNVLQSEFQQLTDLFTKGQ